MKAVWFEKFGAARDVLIVGDHADPEPGADQVLVRLATSGVNPSDVKKRAGAFPNLLDDGLVIPHSDGAGVIEAVGKNVRDRQPGDRVWVCTRRSSRGDSGPRRNCLPSMHHARRCCRQIRITLLARVSAFRQ